MDARQVRMLGEQVYADTLAMLDVKTDLDANECGRIARATQEAFENCLLSDNDKIKLSAEKYFGKSNKFLHAARSFDACDEQPTTYDYLNHPDRTTE